MAFVYALVDPRTLEVRYVGSANDPHKRFKQHLNERAKSWNLVLAGITPKYTKKVAWLTELWLLNLEPTLVLLTECSIEEKWFWECFWQSTCNCLYAPVTRNLVNDKGMSMSVRATK